MTGLVVEFGAHDLVQTKPCKIPGCEWEAEDQRGRYAGLCSDHKKAKIEDDRGSMQRASAAAGAQRQRVGTPAAVATAKELHKQARTVARTEAKLADERDELRRIYLRFGVEAGFLRSSN